MTAYALLYSLGLLPGAIQILRGFAPEGYRYTRNNNRCRGGASILLIFFFEATGLKHGGLALPSRS